VRTLSLRPDASGARPPRRPNPPPLQRTPALRQPSQDVTSLEDARRALEVLPEGADEAILLALRAAPVGEFERTKLAILAQQARRRTVREALGDPALTRRWEAVLGLRGTSVVARYLVERARVVRGHRPYPGMTVEALEAWARDNGVAEWLSASVAEALPRLVEEGLVSRSDMTLASIVCRPPGSDDLRRETAEEVITELERLVDVAQAAIADERDDRQRRCRPADPVLGRLWDALRSRRDRLRGATGPRARRLREAATLTLEPAGPSLRYHEPGGPPRCVGRSARERPVVTLDLLEEGSEVRVTCSCPEPRRGGCGLRLSAVDRALDLLGLDADAELRDEVGRAVGTPPWERLLDTLERLGAASSEVELPYGADETLGWRVLGSGSRLELRPAACRPKKRGEGWVIRDLPWESLDAPPVLARLPLDADRAVMRGWRREHGAGLAVLPRRVTVQLLGQLIDHPRVFSREQSVRRLEVREAELCLALSEAQAGGARLAVSLDGASLAPEAARQLLDRVAGDRAARLDDATLVLVHVPPAVRRVLTVVAEWEQDLPPEAVPEVLRRVPSLARLMPLEVEAGLRGRQIAWSGALEAHVEIVDAADEEGPADGPGLRVGFMVRPLPGAWPMPPGEGPEVLFDDEGGDTVHVVRDRAAERAAMEAIAAEVGLGPEERVEANRWLVRSPDTSLDVLEALRAPRDGLEVRWADGAGGRKVARTAALGDLRLVVGRRRDWFQLEGGLVIDGIVVPLGALLAALRDARRFVAVGESGWVRLAEPLIAALSTAADAVSERRDGALELPGLAAPWLLELEREGVEVDAPDAWHDLIERVEAAAELDVPIPEGLQGTLRGYQVEGFRWLARLAHWGAGGCLADDMGLGKTVQALALLLRRASLGPAMVVAPTSVGFNWVREAERFAPELSLRLFRGKGHEDLLTGLGPGDVVVTSYDLVGRYLDRLAGQHFSTLVLDEAQAIKNPDTQRAQAVFALSAGFRVALTGTPLENRTGELWSLFRAVAPGLLGSARSFRDRFALPIERDGDGAARARLARLVRPFILRRLKAVVAPELPPRTEVRVDVPLSRAERALYEDVRRSAARALADPEGAAAEPQARFLVLAALNRLRQLACHPRLVDPGSSVPSSKLDKVRELIAELREEGHRVLVFSQFTRHLALVREAIEADGASVRYLDGSTPEARRRTEIDAFQAGDGDVFLLSVKAGGTGLNLTAADYVLHIDPWWNPAVEDQATDRAHRIGQERPVTVIRVVAKGTIEEAILDLHADKRALVEAVLAGTGKAGALTTDELTALIREASAEATDDDE